LSNHLSHLSGIAVWGEEHRMAVRQGPQGTDIGTEDCRRRRPFPAECRSPPGWQEQGVCQR
jgi:hypothetical protein